MTTISINIDAEPEQLAQQLENLAIQIRNKSSIKNKSSKNKLKKACKTTTVVDFLDKVKNTIYELQEPKILEVKVTGTAEVEIYGIESYEFEDQNFQERKLVNVLNYDYNDNDVTENPEVKKIFEDRINKAKELIADVKKFAEDNGLNLRLVWQEILEE